MGIARPVMENFPYAWAFFVPFILIATFTMLNLFIAIIVNAMQSFTENEQKETVAAVEQAREHIEADVHAEVRAMRDEIRELKALLLQAGPPPAPSLEHLLPAKNESCHERHHQTQPADRTAGHHDHSLADPDEAQRSGRPGRRQRAAAGAGVPAVLGRAGSARRGARSTCWRCWAWSASCSPAASACCNWIRSGWRSRKRPFPA